MPPYCISRWSYSQLTQKTEIPPHPGPAQSQATISKHLDAFIFYCPSRGMSGRSLRTNFFFSGFAHDFSFSPTLLLFVSLFLCHHSHSACRRPSDMATVVLCTVRWCVSRLVIHKLLCLRPRSRPHWQTAGFAPRWCWSTVQMFLRDTNLRAARGSHISSPRWSSSACRLGPSEPRQSWKKREIPTGGLRYSRSLYALSLLFLRT
jgi:hypothetical protein